MARIGVSMRVVNAIAYHDPRDAISHDVVRWLMDDGHHPVLVPNTPHEQAFTRTANLEAIILTGGNSLRPVLGASDDTSPERTATEHILADHACERRVPLLGICRGLHLINDYFGGQLTSKLPHAPVQHVARSHCVQILPPFSTLSDCREIETNSFHNQGICAHDIAATLTAFAVATGDGLIEGLYHATLPVLAVQWHPERPHPAHDFDGKILRRFLRQGKFW